MQEFFQDPSVRALLLSTFAGMSTMLGAVVIFFTKKSERVVTIALGFAAGVMLSVSFVDLFPEAHKMLAAHAGSRLGVLLCVLFLGLGIGLAALIDVFVPHEGFDQAAGGKKHNNLFRAGLVSTIAIALHNFPEGIATFMGGYADPSLGASIALAIALHNIPEGITVAMPIYYATGKKGKAVLYTFISGIAEPLGALVAFLVLRPFINDLVLGALFAIVAGIMIYIAVEELIPSSRQYGHDRDALLATFAGILLMPLTMMF